jgi:hypothetical protein
MKRLLFHVNLRRLRKKMREDYDAVALLKAEPR